MYLILTIILDNIQVMIFNLYITAIGIPNIAASNVAVPDAVNSKSDAASN